MKCVYVKYISLSFVCVCACVCTHITWPYSPLHWMSFFTSHLVHSPFNKSSLLDSTFPPSIITCIAPGSLFPPFDQKQHLQRLQDAKPNGHVSALVWQADPSHLSEALCPSGFQDSVVFVSSSRISHSCSGSFTGFSSSLPPLDIGVFLTFIVRPVLFSKLTS